MTDFHFANHGSICILTPLSQEAVDWVSERIPDDAQRWGQCGVVIEPRYCGDIIDGIASDGLTITDD